MSRARRLATLVKLAGMAERNGRRNLGRAVSRLQESQTQQQQLESYMDEYAQEWLARGQRGMSGSELRRSADFRVQLGHTIDLQQQRIAQFDQDVDSAAARWRGTRTREQSLERLLDIEVSRLQTVRERRQQLELDDDFNRRKKPAD